MKCLVDYFAVIKSKIFLSYIDYYYNDKNIYEIN